MILIRNFVVNFFFSKQFISFSNTSIKQVLRALTLVFTEFIHILMFLFCRNIDTGFKLFYLCLCPKKTNRWNDRDEYWRWFENVRIRFQRLIQSKVFFEIVNIAARETAVADVIDWTMNPWCGKLYSVLKKMKKKKINFCGIYATCIELHFINANFS